MPPGRSPSSRPSAAGTGRRQHRVVGFDGGALDTWTDALGAVTNTPTNRIPDGQVFTEPWPATSSEKARGIPDRVIYYQYRRDRARRTVRGIDEQVAKAQRAVDGHAPVKRNRFIKLTGATKSVNRDLEAKARGRARIEGMHHQPHQPGTGVRHRAYHQRWRTEMSFRMSEHDLQARPVYHHKRQSIEARLTIVFATLAVSHTDRAPNRLDHQKFVRTARRHRTVRIEAGSDAIANIGRGHAH
jgi:hypothetical protein